MTKPETFGHEPVTAEDVFFGEMADDPPVCARCWRTVRTWSSWTTGHDERAGVQWENGWITYQDRIPWPCTTAVVLGLAPRPAAEPDCTCIHEPEEDAGVLLHASYCAAA